MKLFILRFILSTAIISPLVYGDTNLVSKPAVKVNCLYPLSGPAGLYGRDSRAAIRMAQDVIKASANEGYPELDIRIHDTRSKTLRAMQIVRSLINTNEVDFLCGIVSSETAQAVSAIAREKKVFFIGTDHASPQLTNELLHPYYFRVSNGSRLSMRAGAKYIREHYASDKPLRIAFIGPDYDYGYQSWDDLKRFLEEEKVSFTVVTTLWPQLYANDYSIYIHQLIDAKPDILVNGQWGEDLVTFVKQAKALGLLNTSTFMNFDAGGNYEILAKLGADMPLGLVLSARHHVNWPETTSNRDFVNRFKEITGRYPSYAAQGAYAGIIAIATAVKNAGGTKNHDALISALETLKLSLPEDPPGFTSYMDSQSHQLLQVQAIGKTVANKSFPPAQVLLGEWNIYPPPTTWPKFAAPTK